MLVQKIAEVENRDLSPVLIPEDAQVGELERYGLVKFICAASDCDSFLRALNPETPTWATQRGTMDDVFTTSAITNGSITLVVENTMVDEVKVKDKKFEIVHQNYIIGILDE